MGKGTTAAIILCLVFLSMAIGAALGTMAAGNASTVTVSGVSSATSSTTATNSTSPYVLTLVITTNNVFNSTVGPQPAYFVLGSNGLEASSNITLPANRLIEVVIMNFDEGNATLTGTQYANVMGTVNGTMSFYNNDVMNATQGPSGIVLQGAQTVTSLSLRYVSHTFTVPSLGLNIPIAAESTEVAYFRTGGPGSYLWLCQSLCGSGANGLDGAMSTPGWMNGLVTVT
jgi:heme/copper-type cytochrome/quinol oxidase subunit 2